MRFALASEKCGKVFFVARFQKASKKRIERTAHAHSCTTAYILFIAEACERGYSTLRLSLSLSRFPIFAREARNSRAILSSLRVFFFLSFFYSQFVTVCAPSSSFYFLYMHFYSLLPSLSLSLSLSLSFCVCLKKN